MRAAPSNPFGHVEGVEEHGQADGHPDQQHGQAGVQLGHVPQRDGDALGHQLALVPAGVRAGARGRRAGRQHQAQQHQEPPAQRRTGRGTTRVAGARPVLAGRAVHQHHGVDDQEHRGQEVDHDHVGVELGVDDDGADGPPGPAPRRPGPRRARSGPGGTAGDGRRPTRVAAKTMTMTTVTIRFPNSITGWTDSWGVNWVLVARRPVRTAQPGPGEADRGPDQHDEHREDHRQPAPTCGRCRSTRVGRRTGCPSPPSSRRGPARPAMVPVPDRGPSAHRTPLRRPLRGSSPVMWTGVAAGRRLTPMVSPGPGPPGRPKRRVAGRAPMWPSPSRGSSSCCWSPRCRR